MSRADAGSGPTPDCRGYHARTARPATENSASSHRHQRAAQQPAAATDCERWIPPQQTGLVWVSSLPRRAGDSMHCPVLTHVLFVPGCRSASEKCVCTHPAADSREAVLVQVRYLPLARCRKPGADRSGVNAGFSQPWTTRQNSFNVSPLCALL